MSTHAQTIDVHDNIRWFLTGIAAAIVAVALAAVLAFAMLPPAAQHGVTASEEAPYSLLDPALRAQRAGEIGGGSNTAPYSLLDPALRVQRAGEIGAGQAPSSESSLYSLMEFRKSEITGGR